MKTPRPFRPRYPWADSTDWEARVSVCIAGLCEESKSVVCISDKKVSFGEFSAEDAVIKAEPLWRDGSVVMFAGDDVSHADPIIQHAHGLLSEGWDKSKRPQKRRQGLPTTILADALDVAYQWRLQKQIETSVLRSYGYTVATFKKYGRKECTEHQHADICRRIDQVHLDGLVFLLAGFSPNGHGHIWTINGSDAPRLYDRLGAWAIGSGARAALSLLSHYTSTHQLGLTHCSLERLIYCGLTAKFMAEGASDVGRFTFVTVTRRAPEPRIRFMGNTDIEKVRAYWDEHGAPRVSEDFESEIRGFVKTVEQLTPQSSMRD